MNIYLGSDHAGYHLKEEIQKYLKSKNYHAIDLGVFNEDSADYPDIAREVAEKVREHKDSFGILICGTGIGMCMTANKIPGIRAANCESEFACKMAREHNDAQILCVGGRILDIEKAKTLIDIFLTTPFSGEERHKRRVKKIESYED